MTGDSFHSIPPPPDEGQVLRRRLQLWIVARNIGAILLVGGTALAHGTTGFTARGLGLLAVGIFATTALLSAALLRNPTTKIAWALLSFDLIFTTGLIYLTGAGGSPLGPVYASIVVAAAMTIGPRSAMVVAGVAILLFLTVAMAVAQHHLPVPPDQSPRLFELTDSELAYASLAHTVAIGLVARLASQLAERLNAAGGRLREAQESAARLAGVNDAIVRSMAAGLITTDDQERVVTVNPAGLEMLGANDDSLEGRPINEVFPGLQRNQMRGEILVPTLRGEGQIPIGYTSTRLQRAEGGSLIVFQDLTEIVALRDTAERAERHATLGRLAAGLAHEIRNPLGSISGSVQLVREAPTMGEEDRALLEVVLSEVDRLNELVSSMLDVGRPVVAERSVVDVGALFSDVVAVASTDTTLRRAHLILDLRDSPLMADVDGDQIRQVVWNLLKNAVQASPEGEEVRIEAGFEDETLVFSIADAGPGIAEDKRARLFDMFYSERSQGIGIGLALVQQLVQAHGGTIGVFSSAAGGALFEVRIPLGGAPRLSSIPPQVRDES